MPACSGLEHHSQTVIDGSHPTTQAKFESYPSDAVKRQVCRRASEINRIPTYDARMAPPRTYRVRVLGCRVNHAERREVESVLRDRGLKEAVPGRPADLEIVHTCSVTGRAAAKSRQAARRAKQSHNSTLLLTGCLVGSNRDQAELLTGNPSHAIGHDLPMPLAVASWFDAQWANGHQKSCPKVEESILPLPLAAMPNQPANHVRAEVRIQDGCDAHCTFCIIPTTRPVLRTKSISTVTEEVERLVDLGHREVVLAGIFLGAFGHETALRRRQQHRSAAPLADLVDAVASVQGLARLRLSSLEPGDVSDALLTTLAAHPEVVVPHLHLPLQSGSDRVLRRMNRQYRVADYLDMVDRATHALSRNGIPPAFTTDIICGFPGETTNDFEQTVAIAERVGYLHMHVFPFSPRHGTAAARWKDQFVPDAIRTERVRHLIDLETRPDGLSERFRRRLAKHPLRLLAEQPDPHRSGNWLGRCDHYAMVSVKIRCERGDLVRAMATEIEDDVIIAEAETADCSLPMLARH